MDKKPLIIITGPTAVGKTALSIELAKKINGEIISADSMQVYKKMDIGTAKVTKEEMSGVKHYLIDELNPDEDFNVARFKEMASQAVKEIYEKGKIPVVAGGTGFYIQALLYDIDFEENDGDMTYRHELMKIAEEQGAGTLHRMLAEVDYEAACEIHENNVKRVIRALEYNHQTGRKISEHNKEQREKESPYDFLYFVITDDRSLLYERIDKRIDIMMENGLTDEVHSLIEGGCTKDMTSMQGIGYQEFFDYFDGRITLEQAVYNLKLNTRHFAKRQLTWFKREKNVIWMDYCGYDHNKERMLEAIMNIIGEHYKNGNE